MSSILIDYASTPIMDINFLFLNNDMKALVKRINAFISDVEYLKNKTHKNIFLMKPEYDGSKESQFVSQEKITTAKTPEYTKLVTEEFFFFENVQQIVLVDKIRKHFNSYIKNKETQDTYIITDSLIYKQEINKKNKYFNIIKNNKKLLSVTYDKENQYISKNIFKADKLFQIEIEKESKSLSNNIEILEKNNEYIFSIKNIVHNNKNATLFHLKNTQFKEIILYEDNTYDFILKSKVKKLLKSHLSHKRYEKINNSTDLETMNLLYKDICEVQNFSHLTQDAMIHIVPADKILQECLKYKNDYSQNVFYIHKDLKQKLLVLCEQMHFNKKLKPAHYPLTSNIVIYEVNEMINAHINYAHVVSSIYDELDGFFD